MGRSPIPRDLKSYQKEVVSSIIRSMANKQKTRKSVSRRFKISATGKVIRRVAFGRHLRRNKTAAQRRTYRKSKVVTGKIARRVKRLMAIA